MSLTWHLREGHSIIRTAFPKGCPHFIPTLPAIPPTHPTLVTPGVARKKLLVAPRAARRSLGDTRSCQEKLLLAALVGSRIGLASHWFQTVPKQRAYSSYWVG